MGETSAEGILGYYVKNVAVLRGDVCLLNKGISAILPSFNSEKLKYVQSKACGYDKCEFSSTHEAVLMVENEGARKNEF